MELERKVEGDQLIKAVDELHSSLMGSLMLDVSSFRLRRNVP